MTLAPILYAEDNDNDIELTIEAFKLTKLDNPLIILKNGQEVLDFVRCEGSYADKKCIKPALVLMDIKMPKITGLEALEILKKKEGFCSIPIVMLTASEMERDLIKAYQLGANGFVTKPFDFVEYKKTIEAIVNYWIQYNKTI